jgi:hypothetical protein
MFVFVDPQTLFTGFFVLHQVRDLGYKLGQGWCSPSLSRFRPHLLG